MSKPLAVALMSGGMDSTLCAAMARSSGFALAGLHLNYGQKTEKRELRAFHDIADFFDITQRLAVDIGYLTQIGGSSLTAPDIPVAEADLENDDIPSSYVPFRNAHILAIAVSWAEVVGATALYVGAVQEDSSGYPDCRQSFYDAFQRAVDEGTKPETNIRIHTPVITFSKMDIVRKSIELGAPLHLTWSCYQNEDLACGRCDSCALRLRGFRQADIADPAPYATMPETEPKRA